MKTNFAKFLTFAIVFSLLSNCSYAKESIKMYADVNEEFTIAYQDLPNEIQFKVTDARTISNELMIPENSTVTLEVLRAQRELRWHKSGLILCKLKNYIPEGLDIPIDVSDKDIYLTVNKYEKVDKKEATLIGLELVLAQGAGVFAPGADIGYFFIKGAIQRKKHPNWFKAGVRNAYDNSIFWFCQKGKNIELTETDKVQIKNLKAKNVEKTIAKIDRRNSRFERQAANRIAKKETAALKREFKNQSKLSDCNVVETAIEDIVVDRSVLAEVINKDMEK